MTLIWKSHDSIQEDRKSLVSEPSVSRAKAPPVERSEKDYRDENVCTLRAVFFGLPRLVGKRKKTLLTASSFFELPLIQGGG